MNKLLRELARALHVLANVVKRRALVLLILLVIAAGYVAVDTLTQDDEPISVPLDTALEVLDAGGANVNDDEAVAAQAPAAGGWPVEAAHVDDNTQTLTLVAVDPDDADATSRQPDPADLPDGRQLAAVFPGGSAEQVSERVADAGVPFTAEAFDDGGFWTGDTIAQFVIVGLILSTVLWMMPGSGSPFGGGKSSPVERPSTRFSDVAGCDEAAEELQEAVEYLRDPERLKMAGASAPRGYLLTGPPGTGKTLLARAVAGEAGVPFYATSGSEFVEVFVGVGASRARKVFKKARENAPAIVFIDEVDAIGQERGRSGLVGNREHENTLNQLLVEMDGFAESSIIVIAATNRDELLDSALTRPGRLERRVTVPLPDLGGRRRILDLYAEGRDLTDDVDLESLARRTAGMSGADLEALMNTAALNASRASTRIDTQVLDDALTERRMGRARTSAMVTARDREITAWHEAGHAVAALALPSAEDPVAVTIVPRGPSGGATHMDAPEDTYVTREQARSRLTVALAGRAAEELLLEGDFTNGSSGDLRWATNLASSMVAEYGMSDLGPVHVPEGHGGCRSDRRVNDAVAALTSQALEDAREVLAANRTFVARVVEMLEERETVTVGEMRDAATARGAALPSSAPWHTQSADVATNGHRPSGDPEGAVAV